MAAMSSSQIVSATALHNKGLPGMGPMRSPYGVGATSVSIRKSEWAKKSNSTDVLIAGLLIHSHFLRYLVWTVPYIWGVLYFFI